MSEGSAFWDGQATGDAAGNFWAAPYSSSEFGDIFNIILGSDSSSRAYVIANYLNNLKIQAASPAAMSVIIKSGAVYLRGKIYKNDADKTLTIGTADATNPRIDRIILRVNYTAQTITPAILAGTAAATPTPAALTQNATTYELSIGYVWVAATATTISNAEIHDERIFAPNFDSLLGAIYHQNLIRNSEFMVFSGSSSQAPDAWSLVNTPAVAVTTKSTAMSRGRSIQITASGASEGIQQTVRVKASTTYALLGLINVTAGDVGYVEITTNSASPGTMTRNIRRTGSYQVVLFYYTTEADATTLTLKLEALNTTDVVTVGQWIVVEGFIPGPFRQIRETIMFDQRYPEAANYTLGALATGTYTVDTDTEWPSVLADGCYSAIVELYIAGSAFADIRALNSTGPGVGQNSFSSTDANHLLIPVTLSSANTFTLQMNNTSSGVLGLALAGAIV